MNELNDILKRNALQVILLAVSIGSTFAVLQVKTSQVEALTIENKTKLESQQSQLNAILVRLATIEAKQDNAIQNQKDLADNQKQTLELLKQIQSEIKK